MARSGRPTPRLLVFALLGMANWVYQWYDPAGEWDADTIAAGFIALLEPGYLVTPRSRQREVADTFRRIETRAAPALRPPSDGLVAFLARTRASRRARRALTGAARCTRARRPPEGGRSPPPGITQALKYFASGWWKTSADTDASGSIMKPSVSCMPMRSGCSSRHSVA